MARFLLRHLKGYRFLIVIAVGLTFAQVGASDRPPTARWSIRVPEGPDAALPPGRAEPDDVCSRREAGGAH